MSLHNYYLFTITIAVYNRPNEIKDLLESLLLQEIRNFEVVVVEDGSTKTSEQICEQYADRLNLRYIKQENTGPALARNRGAINPKSTGEYLLFFDSDCILPKEYMSRATKFVRERGDIDLFGGPDAAMDSFTPTQKAISYAMTSPMSTGGIRGGHEMNDRFYPRTFNMCVRRSVFLKMDGFADLRYGEDVDFSYRVVEAGYSSALVKDLFVYHKRRDTLSKFFRQIYHSGEARRMLARRHPGTTKFLHRLPSIAVCLLLFTLSTFFYYWPLALILSLLALIYGLGIFWGAWRKFRSAHLAWLSAVACAIMVIAYGLGYLKARIFGVRSYRRK